MTPDQPRLQLLQGCYLFLLSICMAWTVRLDVKLLYVKLRQRAAAAAAAALCAALWAKPS